MSKAMLPLIRGSRQGKDTLVKTESRDSYFQPLSELKMDRVFDECRKSLWYGFQTLVDNTTGTAHKTSLKVIISSVGRALGFDKAEEILDDSVGSELDFTLFCSLIHTEIFEKLKASSSESVTLSGADGDEVHGLCWTLWSNKGDYRNGKTRNFSDDDAYKLWRIFNFFAETDSERIPLFPVAIHPEEAQYILDHFVQVTGQVSKEITVKHIGEQTKCLNFEDFLNLFDTEFASSLPKNGLSHGIKDIYDALILDILKKGSLWKRGHKVKNWKERWFVLTPRNLKYYRHQTEKEHEKKGEITFDKNSKIEELSDKSGSKTHRFVIHTTVKPYDISAPDLKTRNQWTDALRKALDFIEEDVSFQREDANERRSQRETKRNMMAEEERRRQNEAELLSTRQKELEEQRQLHSQDQELLKKRLEELEAHKKTGEELEERLRQEEAEREIEQQKIKELEEIKNQLERLLDEERQAKRDEEIVRAQMARILEEETEKREELERLKAEQEKLLHAEREKREGLEGQKQEQENQLLEASRQLEQLELDRKDADSKLQDLAERLQATERGRVRLEEKEKLWRTPVGLAKPVPIHVNTFVSHRGEGAFSKGFMERKATIDMDESNETETTGEEQICSHDAECTPSVPLRGAVTGSGEGEDEQSEGKETSAPDNTRTKHKHTYENVELRSPPAPDLS